VTISDLIIWNILLYLAVNIDILRVSKFHWFSENWRHLKRFSSLAHKAYSFQWTQARFSRLFMATTITSWLDTSRIHKKEEMLRIKGVFQNLSISKYGFDSSGVLTTYLTKWQSLHLNSIMIYEYDELYRLKHHPFEKSFYSFLYAMNFLTFFFEIIGLSFVDSKPYFLFCYICTEVFIRGIQLLRGNWNQNRKKQKVPNCVRFPTFHSIFSFTMYLAE